MQKRIRGIVTFQRANTTQQTITIIRNSKRGENSGLLSKHGIAQHHNSTRDKLQSGIFTSVHRCKQKMQMSVVLEMYICHRCTVLLTCPLYLSLFFFISLFASSCSCSSFCFYSYYLPRCDLCHLQRCFSSIPVLLLL